MNDLKKKATFVFKNYGLGIFLIKIIKWPFIRIISLVQKLIENRAIRNPKRIIEKLKNFNSNNPKEIINFSSNFYFGLIKPIQIKKEFLELLKIFKEINPNYIMEIGTAKGGTLFSFCKLAKEDAVIISIDLPEGPFGGGYPEWKIPIYQSFKKEKQKLYLLRKNSHQEDTLKEVKKILNGNQLDFLFIDGDHTYEGVKKDFEMYSPLVKKGGGIIAFHDINKCNPNYLKELKELYNLEFGVFELWSNIKLLYKNKEIIEDLKQNSYGIGIIFLD